MLEKFLFENPHGQNLPYLKYTPKELPEDGYPLIVFMHGFGERGPSDGSQVEKIANYGLPKSIAGGKDYPCMIVAPQCPDDNFWPSFMESLNRFLDHVIAENPININRIYLTGMSMGGSATWTWAMGRPDRFAAIAPVCGEGISWYGDVLANLPIWAFHGDIDQRVLPHTSLDMVSRINKCGGHAKLTILTCVKHNAWDYAYTDELIEWLLSHTRPTAIPVVTE